MKLDIFHNIKSLFTKWILFFKMLCLQIFIIMFFQLKAKVKKLEDDIIAYKSNLSSLTKDLDKLTISHSHTLVENSKLTNEKLKLEHELRKSENLYDTTVRSLQQKCNKEVRVRL